MLTKQMWPDHKKAELDVPAIRVIYPKTPAADQVERITRYIQSIHEYANVVCKSAAAPGTETYKLTICMGHEAIKSMLGRYINTYSSRRGFAWDRGYPVVWLPDPMDARSNKFVGQALKEDLEWALTTTFDFDAPGHVYLVIETEEDSVHAVEDMSAAEWTAYDFETSGAMFSDYFECIMMAATTSYDTTYVWGREAIRNSRIWNPVLSWLVDPECPKVGHNIKYDMLAPYCHFGCVVRGVHSDTQLKRKLLLADANSGLELCSDLVGYGGYKQHFGESLKKAKQLINNARSKRTREITRGSEITVNEEKALEFIVERRDLSPENVAYGLVHDEDLEIYCARDAFVTAELETRLDRELSEDTGLRTVWDTVVLPAIPALAAMESHGIQADTDSLDSFAKFVDEKQEQMRKALEDRGLTNPNHAASVAKFLFTDLGLQSRKSTPGGQPSTDAGVLKYLRTAHPAVEELLEYKRLGKLSQAYGESLPRYVTERSRIHPQFRIDGTRTGRMSCSNPGLHQIPRSSSVEGKMIKQTFTAPKGHYLVQIDYSQLEYRVAAMLSQDEAMINLFKAGKDFHQGTAENISQVAWGVEPSAVTKEHRNFAKVVNFGLLYGMTDKGLAERLQCSEMEAAKIRSAVLGGFPQLATWIAKCEYEVQLTGEVRTWWGSGPARIRPLWDSASDVRWQRMKARNAAVNTPVQGTASDFCLASIGRIHQRLENKEFEGKLILTVHDSIILEVPDCSLKDTALRVKDIMEQWPSMGVPLRVDVEYGERWGELKELEL